MVDQLDGLRARLAQERTEDHPEGVEAGQQRAQIAGDVERPVPAAALGESSSAEASGVAC